MTRRLVCLGDVMTDVVAVLSGPLAPGSDSPASITVRGGGAAANTAAWLAASGHPSVTLVARVGADPAAGSALAGLEDHGVALRVVRDPGRRTGTCLVLVTPDGERTMVPDAGANAGLLPEDVPDDLFGPGSHLHLSGYALLDPGSREAGLRALARAREAGSTCSVDPASAAPLAAVGPGRFLDWIDGVDALLANADEASVLTGGSDPVAAARSLVSGFADVVVKLGAEGALWCGRGRTGPFRVPAERVRVVDTTGAGDAFAAGWLPARLAGETPEEALRAGCRLAARAVAHVGARPPATG